MNFQPDKKGRIGHKPKTHLFANVFPHLPVELNFPSLLLPYLQLFPHFEIYIQKSQTKRFFSHSVAFLVVTQFEVRAFYTGWKCQLFLSLQIDHTTKFPIYPCKTNVNEFMNKWRQGCKCWQVKIWNMMEKYTATHILIQSTGDPHEINIAGVKNCHDFTILNSHVGHVLGKVNDHWSYSWS